ncbi:MAG: AraC family transcriptional regulator ligand-binding domain-containing protein [Myxococcota bacterium]
MINESFVKQEILAFSAFGMNQGLSFDDIVELSGMRAGDLLKPGGTAPLASRIRLALGLQEKLAHVSVSLELARQHGQSVISHLIPPMRAAPTAADAFRFLEASAGQFGSGFDFRLERGRNTSTWFMSHPIDRLDNGIGNEAGALSFVNTIRSFAQRPFTPLEVRFPHAPKGHLQSYSDAFGAPVSYERSASETAIVFRRKDLDIELKDADPIYFASAMAHAELTHTPRRDTPIDRLRRAMTHCAKNGQFGLEPAAKHAGMSVRTAQRVAARAGLTPSRMLDDVRAEMMRGILLTDPDMPLSVLAEQLDYSDERSLRRAFRRLTGQSPQEYRSLLRVSS